MSAHSMASAWVWGQVMSSRREGVTCELRPPSQISGGELVRRKACRVVGRGVTGDRTGGESTTGLLWLKQNGWGEAGQSHWIAWNRQGSVPSGWLVYPSPLQEHSGCFVESELGTIRVGGGDLETRQEVAQAGDNQWPRAGAGSGMQSRDAWETGVLGRVRWHWRCLGFWLGSQVDTGVIQQGSTGTRVGEPNSVCEKHFFIICSIIY